VNPFARLILTATAAVYAWRHAERLWKQVKESREQPRPQEDTNEPLSLDATYNEADGSFQVEMWGGTELEQDIAMCTLTAAGYDWKA
jgi:hypothetical protein